MRRHLNNHGENKMTTQANYREDAFIISNTFTGYGNWDIELYYPISGERFFAHTTNARMIDEWKEDDGITRNEDNANDVRDYILNANDL